MLTIKKKMFFSAALLLIIKLDARKSIFSAHVLKHIATTSQIGEVDIGALD